MTFEPLHISSFRLERTLLSVVHRVPKEQQRRQTVKLTPASSVRSRKPNGPIRERPDPSKWNRAARISLQIPVMSNSVGRNPTGKKLRVAQTTDAQHARPCQSSVTRNQKPKPQTQGNLSKPAVQNPVPNPTKRRRPVGGALDTESHQKAQVDFSGFFRFFPGPSRKWREFRGLCAA